MELILVTAVVASLIATCVYLLGFLAAAYRLPDTLPWVGRRDEIFAKMRACMREFTVGDRTLVDGYSQVGLLRIYTTSSLLPDITSVIV